MRPRLGRVGALAGTVAAAMALGDAAAVLIGAAGVMFVTSLTAAAAAIALGLIGLVANVERKSAVLGIALALATVAYWVWVIEGILDTT
jgi:hypothetical protein